jgi:hypothetical protein
MFTKIDYDYNIFYKLLQNHLNLNNNKIDKFIQLINNPNISISGSSILQIISKEFYDNSDIDIYIELNKVNICDIINLIHYLHYNFNEDKNKSLYVKTLNKFILNYNIYSSNKYLSNDNLSDYSSLKKYLKFLIKFMNKNKKIELIFISCNIETILENTFDYDIVKNYWKQSYIYSFNIHSIYTKIATMSISHFTNRVLKTYHEFNNFITRYIKYTNRGYKIFIHKTFITSKIFQYIIDIYTSKNYAYVDLLLYSTINDKLYYSVYIQKYIYSKNKIFILYLEKKQHIIKYILIASIYQNFKLRKKIINYSNYLLEEYLHPDSKYIKYKMELLQNYKSNSITQLHKNKILYYINKYHTLIFIKFR